MKSILEGFLGSFTSRYSDIDGYWLHGLIGYGSVNLDIDLMVRPPDERTTEAAAQRLAVGRFNEQLAKVGLDASRVAEARLTARARAEIVQGWHGHERGEGRIVEFVATAVMDNGHRYERTRTVFVAPHDPKIESRRRPVDTDFEEDDGHSGAP